VLYGGQCGIFGRIPSELDGISGVLSVLGTIFEGGFIAGLPVMFFGRAFWWWHMKPLQKRRAELDDGWKRLAPTWPWAAWTGEIEFRRLNNLGREGKWLVQWKYATRSDANWQPIPRYRTYLDKNGVVKTVRAEKADPAWTDINSGNGGELGGSTSPPKFSTHSPSHLLLCRTIMAFLKVSRIVDGERLTLADRFGNYVWELDACEDIKKELSETQAALICEVIAIFAIVDQTYVRGVDVFVLWIEQEGSWVQEREWKDFQESL
jgi:hypothetical protein